MTCSCSGCNCASIAVVTVTVVAVVGMNVMGVVSVAAVSGMGVAATFGKRSNVSFQTWTKESAADWWFYTPPKNRSQLARMETIMKKQYEKPTKQCFHQSSLELQQVGSGSKP